MVVGGLGVAATIAGVALDPGQGFRSYLFGYWMWLDLTVGCLALLMLHHMTGGAWGYVIRRVLEAGVGNILVIAALAVPILAGLGHVYPWAQAEHVAGDPILLGKSKYLNPTFFMARGAVLFLFWSGAALLLRRWSAEQDKDPSPSLAARMKTLSAPGLLLFGLSVTFAGIDWTMSLEPHWYSTVYGLQFMVIDGLLALSFGIAVAALARGCAPLRTERAADHFHDLGNLLLAFTMLWAYMMFSQFIITWSGNLTDEIPWYLRRARGTWGRVGVVLLVLHFVVPFFLLLRKPIKRNPVALARLAVWILAMEVVDHAWFILPAFGDGAGGVHWTDIAAAVGIGGVWLFLFFGRLSARPLVPLADPQLPAAFRAGSAATEHAPAHEAHG
jgi:hypothetical protein